MKKHFKLFILTATFLFISLQFASYTTTLKASTQGDKITVNTVKQIQLFAFPKTANDNAVRIRLSLDNATFVGYTAPGGGWLAVTQDCNNGDYFDTNVVCVSLVKSTPVLKGDDLGSITIKFDKNDTNVTLSKTSENGYSDGTTFHSDSGVLNEFTVGTPAIIISSPTTPVSSEATSVTTAITPYSIALIVVIIVILIVIGVIVIVLKRTNSKKVKLGLSLIGFTLLAGAIVLGVKEVSVDLSPTTSNADVMCQSNSASAYNIKFYNNGVENGGYYVDMSANGSNNSLISMPQGSTGVSIQILRSGFSSSDVTKYISPCGQGDLTTSGYTTICDCATSNLQSCLSTVANAPSYKANTTLSGTTNICQQGGMTIVPSGTTANCPANRSSKFIVTTYKNGTVARTIDYPFSNIEINPIMGYRAMTYNLKLASDETGIKIDYQRSGYSQSSASDIIAACAPNGRISVTGNSANVCDCSTGDISKCLTNISENVQANSYVCSTGVLWVSQDTQPVQTCPAGATSTFRVTTYDIGGNVLRTQDFVSASAPTVYTDSTGLHGVSSASFNLNSNEYGFKLDLVLSGGYSSPDHSQITSTAKSFTGTYVTKASPETLTYSQINDLTQLDQWMGTYSEQSLHGTSFCSAGNLTVTRTPPSASSCPINGSGKFVITTYKNGTVSRTQEFPTTVPTPQSGGSVLNSISSFNMQSDETGLRIDYVRSGYGTRPTTFSYPDQSGTALFQDATIAIKICTAGDIASCLSGANSGYLALNMDDSTVCTSKILRVIGASIITPQCEDLWTYTQANPTCTKQTYCEAIPANSYSTQAACQAASDAASCHSYWWYDNNDKTCSAEKQFCGAYQYQGLQTFTTQQTCLTSSTSITCGPIDVNNDGKLDLIDLAAFAKVYGRTCNDTNTSTFGACGAKDTDNSGKIDIVDFASFGKRYGLASCAVPVSFP